MITLFLLGFTWLDYCRLKRQLFCAAWQEATLSLSPYYFNDGFNSENWSNRAWVLVLRSKRGCCYIDVRMLRIYIKLATIPFGSNEKVSPVLSSMGPSIITLMDTLVFSVTVRSVWLILKQQLLNEFYNMLQWSLSMLSNILFLNSICTIYLIYLIFKDFVVRPITCVLGWS